MFFFFNDTATPEIYTLSLHDALPICTARSWRRPESSRSSLRLNPGQLQVTSCKLQATRYCVQAGRFAINDSRFTEFQRSEEHTSELQSQSNLVCRLLLEKKKKKKKPN